MPSASSVAAKATTALSARAPKLSSRLGEFYIIIVAAFMLLGFYVCFKKVKTIHTEVLALKARVHNNKCAAGPPSVSIPPVGGAPPGPEPAPVGKPPQDLDADDFINIIHDIRDAGPHEMIGELVSSAVPSGLDLSSPLGPDSTGVMIVVGPGPSQEKPPPENSKNLWRPRKFLENEIEEILPDQPATESPPESV